MTTSLFGVLNIAGDGMAAMTAAMDISGQNVANVNTPGYSQVNINLETTQTGDAYAGSVQTGSVVRTYDQFTSANLLTEQGLSGAANARSQALGTLQAAIDPGTGSAISDYVNNFFSSLTSLEASPSDPSARAAVLQTASDLSQSISTTAASLASQKTALLTQAQGVATQLNGQLTQIASLNGAIAAAKAEGGQPSDLEDQRDALVGQVSTEIGAQVVQDPSGSYTVLSAGTALVSGTSSSTISVGLDSSGNMQVTANQPGGMSDDITANLNAGTLGGIREARDTDVAGAATQLDQFAYNLATSVNAVQSTGYGLDGQTGRNLFTQPSAVAGSAAAFSVDPTVAGNPAAVAASGSAANLPGGNDIAVQLAGLATTPLAGGQPPAQSFGAIASQVGDAVSSASSEVTLRNNTVTQAQDLNQSASGVSLDEQMTDMTQFQNAYEASAKVIQTVQSLLQTLMQEL